MKKSHLKMDTINSNVLTSIIFFTLFIILRGARWRILAKPRKFLKHREKYGIKRNLFQPLYFVNINWFLTSRNWKLPSTLWLTNFELLKGHFKKGTKEIINSRIIRSVSKSYLPSKVLFTSSNKTKDVTIRRIIKH